MKVSLVWTASFVAVVILLASGCAERRVVRLQPIPALVQPQRPPPRQSPVVQPVVAVPEVAAEPEEVVPISPPVPDEEPVASIPSPAPPAETVALNAAPAPKPTVSKPVKAGESVIKDAPPPPQVEVVGKPPGADYAWIPGAWQWRDRWVWTRGCWALKPRSDAVWAKGHWIERDGGWVWVRGYWR